MSDLNKSMVSGACVLCLFIGLHYIRLCTSIKISLKIRQVNIPIRNVHAGSVHLDLKTHVEDGFRNPRLGLDTICDRLTISPGDENVVYTLSVYFIPSVTHSSPRDFCRIFT